MVGMKFVVNILRLYVMKKMGFVKVFIPLEKKNLMSIIFNCG